MYSISASGDRSIRLWDINTGAHLFTLDSAHPRGIASLDFLPSTGSVLGTIATGSSDATVRLCRLVHTPGNLEDTLDNLSVTEVATVNREVSIEEGPVCWTDCVCPPAIRKVNSTHCMRCWNRGHTALVRTLCLNGDNLISGGYDGTVKVSLPPNLHSFTMLKRTRARQ
jgi:WD40 repeat protein